LLRRIWDKLKRLWTLAKSERATPREIGWAVAIGAFAGCTPAVGFHGALAIGLATLLKKNRLFAWLGARISNMVFLPFIVIAEVQVAHYLRTGTFQTLDREHAIDQAGALLLDWFLGLIPVGGAIAAVMGIASWALALRRDRRKAARAAKAAAPSSAACPASPALASAPDPAPAAAGSPAPSSSEPVNPLQ
jgi:uncharacterized protein